MSKHPLSLPIRIAAASALVLVLEAAAAPPLPIVDTHAHINNQIAPGPARQMGNSGTDFYAAVEAAIQRMDRAGIHRSFLLPPPSPPGARNAYEAGSLRFALEKHPGRFALAGGGGGINAMIQMTPAENVTEDDKRRLRSAAERLAEEDIVSFGEIGVHHLSMRSMGPQHAYYWIPADHPLLLELADVAAERGLPIDLHIDLVTEDMERPNRPIFNDATPQQLKANLAAFERLLQHNRKAKIIWAHAGTDPLGIRVPRLQRQLLTRHPNLYMSIRLGRVGPSPMAALGPGNTLKPDWLNLISDFPDRFVLGSDYFHGPESMAERGPEGQSLENYRAMLLQIPETLAEAVGWRNAENIFRFKR